MTKTFKNADEGDFACSELAMPSRTSILVDNLSQSPTRFAMNVPFGESSKHHSIRCTKR